jgi:hypothetical protein
MRILLQTDSRIPNVALMKYSTWAKDQGHEVGFHVTDPDLVVVSCVFEKNLHRLTDGLRWFAPGARVEIGGPGADPSKLLPPEIEVQRPDYSLYPEFKDSIGYVTAGCIRRCPFCVVPHQGGIRYVQHVSDFYRGEGTVRILDDNILAIPKAFDETARWLTWHEVETRLEYLDIRLVTKAVAERLARLKVGPHGYYFAYDITDPKIEPLIERNVDFLEAQGIARTRIKFFIYLSDQTEAARRDACHRWRFIRALGCEVFGMADADRVHDRPLKRRMTRPAIWRHLTPEEVFGLA